MGISIDLYHANADELIAAYSEWSDGSDSQRIHDILASCGSFLGDVYVLLNNEHYGEYNPYYTLFELLDTEYGHDDSMELFWKHSREGITSVDKENVAERLGIELEKDGDSD